MKNALGRTNDPPPPLTPSKGNVSPSELKKHENKLILTRILKKKQVKIYLNAHKKEKVIKKGAEKLN